MEEKLKLNDGTELNGRALESDGTLFLYIFGKTMKEVFELLSVVKNVKVITATKYGEDTVYKNYSHLKAISEESGDMISAVMKKAVR